MKKCCIVIVLIAVLFTLCCSTPTMARIWNARTLSFDCGVSPSMAMLYGVQPVISHNSIATRLTPFGEETYLPVNNNLFISGDGKNTVVGYNRPINYGNDGQFYSSTITGQYQPKQINGGSGTAWIYPTNSSFYAPVSTDNDGGLYMACYNSMAKLVNGIWSTAVNLNNYGISQAVDMDISSFGDIAIYGWSSGFSSIAWYDYKHGGWNSRSYELSYGNVEWDINGNLGFAYSTGTWGTPSAKLKFDYLDMSTGLWTSETVDTGQGYFAGVALEYDRFGNPVIASGKTLFYDPVPTVPEPSSIIALSFGLVLLSKLRKKS